MIQAIAEKSSERVEAVLFEAQTMLSEFEFGECGIKDLRVASRKLNNLWQNREMLTAGGRDEVNRLRGAYRKLAVVEDEIGVVLRAGLCCWRLYRTREVEAGFKSEERREYLRSKVSPLLDVLDGMWAKRASLESDQVRKVKFLRREFRTMGAR
ncbi:hypothetical protein [Poriferisphaera sp. WC338]|uniref:hypothetical protein n=1 Tax=Poriferisphaera sp. WC338 TaxID=3425129 RepID=UPI003D81C065